MVGLALNLDWRIQALASLSSPVIWLSTVNNPGLLNNLPYIRYA
jgi:hypothetical protein